MNTVSEKVLFRKVFVDNLKYYFEDKKVEGYVYLTSDQEMPKADEYIEDYLHILKNPDGVLKNPDKTYYLLVDRSEYESDDLAELEKHLFDWAEDEYHNGNYEIVDVEDAKDSTLTFQFNSDELVRLIKGLETAVEYAVLDEAMTEPLKQKLKIAFNKLHGDYAKARDEFVSAKYVKVRFGLYNDENDPVYDGWYKPQDGRWNGWLQPYVDEKTFKQICKDIIPTKTNNVSEEHLYSKENLGDEDEWLHEFANQKPNKDGYYDVAHGICWCSEED